ncbi:hypothetical protein [Sandarakinorhabdus rubra]|uniref:hypothetical protein n=1 Tax=Sandarakinorhabdus rubra TaxID=2672568 RepID=UPI0013DBAC62|nr:hypothetical protein [Sandarakinorhabdus rubra]
MIKPPLLALALAAAVPAAAQDTPAAPVPAETANCLISRTIAQAHAGIDRHWYARTRDGKWWRNAMDCPTLIPPRSFVFSSPIGSQCSGDIVQIVDFTMGGLNFGSCGLRKWERVEKPAPQRAPRRKD